MCLCKHNTVVVLAALLAVCIYTSALRDVAARNMHVARKFCSVVLLFSNAARITSCVAL